MYKSTYRLVQAYKYYMHTYIYTYARVYIYITSYKERTKAEALGYPGRTRKAEELKPTGFGSPGRTKGTAAYL